MTHYLRWVHLVLDHVLIGVLFLDLGSFHLEVLFLALQLGLRISAYMELLALSLDKLLKTCCVGLLLEKLIS